MRLEDFLNSAAVTRAGIRLGQTMPQRMGEALARLVARTIAWRRPEIYRVVWNNLRHVLEPGVDDARLAEISRSVFEHAGRAHLDFFRAVHTDAAELERQIAFPPELEADLRARLDAGRGVLFLGAHMSGFNLGILRLGTTGVPMQLLSLANPNQGFAILNQLRSGSQVELTPITTQSLRQAIQRLKHGGLVITAIDRPMPLGEFVVPFLGAPSYLPTGPARLAVLTGADVLIGSCHEEPGQGYVLESQIVEISRGQDRQRDVIDNACLLAEALAVWVRRRPEQWLMFNPIWPDEHALREHAARQG